jgi:hypothetical protein
MIVIVLDEEKRGLIAPCKCASKTIEHFARSKSNKWRLLSLEDVQIFKVIDYQFVGIVRNPISWYISGYFHCIRNYFSDRYKPTDFLSHLRLVYNAQNNLHSFANSKNNNIYWHAIMPPPIQLRYYGFNVTKVFKLDSNMFENDIKEYLGTKNLVYENRTPTMKSPDIDLECEDVLKKLSNWGYKYGYDIEESIKNLKVNTL